MLHFKLNNKVIFSNCIIQILALSLALIIRLFTGNSMVFYACNCTDSLFPSKFIYYLLYIARILIASSMLSFSILSNNLCKKKNIASFLLVTLIVIFEYKLLIGCESYLIIICLHILSLYITYKALKKIYVIKYEIIILSICFIALQSIMILFILSLII